jgi:transcriptional regulator with XRE-family HTH domain
VAPETIGQRVRRLRVLRGLTQADLADFAGRSERWVRYLESDRTSLDRRTAGLLAGGLRVDVAVVLCLAPIPAGLVATEPHRHEHPSPETPQLVVHSDLDPDRAAMDAFRLADRRIGGGYLYAAVVSYLNGSIAPRLLTSRAPSFVAAASLTEMAGWMAHDSGRDDLARAHFDRAWDLAQAGQSATLRGDVAAAQAHLDLHAGQPAAALASARRGLAELVRGPHHAGLEARLYAMEARGLAELGRRSQSARLFLRAETALTGRVDEPTEWVAPFDEASLASETAHGLFAAGDYVGARRSAERVIELRQGDRARSRAFALLSLAQTLLSQPRPEFLEASALAKRVAEEAGTVASVRIGRQLQEIRRLLEPHRGIAEIAEFLETTRNGR